MNCILMEDLTKRKVQALLKQEHHEVMRLTREANEHKNKCLICAGVTDLASLLFGVPVVVVKGAGHE